jgi:hypothetical protein
MTREPLLMCAIGKKGVGKSFNHMLLMNGYVAGDPYAGIKGRKVLIMDINDEYGVYNVPALSLNDVAVFSVHPYIEMRRIRPFHPDGRRMTLDEWAAALFYVLNRYQNGMLLIEDPSKFMGDHLPHDLVGAIATNRHIGLDILLSFQSIGRINTKVWGNMNLLRFHKNVESVERHKNKFPDKYEILRIAEIMVNNEYHRGNQRFFVYVDLEDLKINGDITDDLINEAIEQYVNEKHTDLVKPLLAQKESGKKRYTPDSAFQAVKQRLREYYFNK